MPSKSVFIYNCHLHFRPGLETFPKGRNWAGKIWLIFLSGNCCNDDTELEKEKYLSHCCQESDVGLNAKSTLPSSQSSEREECSIPGHGSSVNFSCYGITYTWLTCVQPLASCPFSVHLSFAWVKCTDSGEVKHIQDTLLRVLDSFCYFTVPAYHSRYYEMNTYTLQLICVPLIRSWWQGDTTQQESLAKGEKTQFSYFYFRPHMNMMHSLSNQSWDL